MNNFERKIYEQLFELKIDFYTRSINNSNFNSVNKNKKNLTEPLDANEEYKGREVNFESNSLSSKAKKVIAFTVVIAIIVSIFSIYYIYSSTSDNEQIANYQASVDTAKRMNNIKYFIDSNEKGYVISNKASNVQNALDQFAKNFDKSELDLDNNSLPYINLASDTLKNIFKDNKTKINNWLGKMDRIWTQEHNAREEYKNILNISATSPRNSAKIAFYKKYGVFNDVIEANKIYKQDKEVFDQIGDFSLSEKNLKAISFDVLSPSSYINYDALVNEIESLTTQKYRNHHLLELNSVKIITYAELKKFANHLESLDFDQAKDRFAINVSASKEENFAIDFEKVKEEIRRVANVKQNVDNDLLKRINDLKYVDSVKSFFSKYNQSEDENYCRNQAIERVSKLNSNESNKRKLLVVEFKKCAQTTKARFLTTPVSNISAEGILQVVDSRTFSSNAEINKDTPLSLVLFKKKKNIEKFLESYDQQVKDIIANKKEASVSSVLFNGTNMIIILPNGISNDIKNYLNKINASSWIYYDYHEQVAEKLKRNK